MLKGRKVISLATLVVPSGRTKTDVEETGERIPKRKVIKIFPMT